MEKDAGIFDIDDVANDECVKMIHRHPHVFGQVKAETSEQVLVNWEAIKTEEKQRVSLADQLEAIPPMLPALMRAQKVSKKTDAGADMAKDILLDDIVKSIEALKTTEEAEGQKQLMGDILFDLTTACRKLGIEAEEALTAATERVIEEVK